MAYNCGEGEFAFCPPFVDSPDPQYYLGKI
jgi:hypothetical protein